MNDNSDSFSISGRIKSFTHAIDGIFQLFKSQPNARIHAFIASVVVVSGFSLSISSQEWCLLVFAITMVLASEGMNTAIEYVCDAVSPEFHPLIKKSKDVAAGAVLISTIGAAIIGMLVFLPYVTGWFV